MSGTASGSGGNGHLSGKNYPKDAQVMISILKDMGVTDYEPKVIDQMLDFAYKYVTNVLEDAKSYSSHAKKRTIDTEDIKLSIQMQCDKSFTNPPPRELLMEIARSKNAQQLPLIKSNTGARLPPDRYTLTSANYRCKTRQRPATQRTIQTGQPQMISKTAPAVNLASKTGATLAVVSKANSSQPSQVTIVSRPSLMQGGSTPSQAPRPLIKLAQRTAGAPMVNVVTKPKPLTVAGMPTVNLMQSNDRKRKAQDAP